MRNGLGWEEKEQVEGWASICTPALTRSQVVYKIKSHLTLIFFFFLKKEMNGVLVNLPWVEAGYCFGKGRHSRASLLKLMLPGVGGRGVGLFRERRRLCWCLINAVLVSSLFDSSSVSNI